MKNLGLILALAASACDPVGSTTKELPRPSFQFNEAGKYTENGQEFTVVVIPKGTFTQAIAVAKYLHQQRWSTYYHLTSEAKWSRDRGVFVVECAERTGKRWCLNPGVDPTFAGARQTFIE